VRRTAAVVLVLVAAIAGGCNSRDGRELPPPQHAGPTTTPAVTEPGGAGDDGAEFVVVSQAVEQGGELPARFTCFGEGISPPLRWSGSPPAAELAIVARDRDDDDAVHWLVTGIDPIVVAFGEDALPEGVSAGPGDGATGWTPPCPERGTHRVQMSLHALGEPLEVDPASSPDAVATQIESSAMGQAVLDVTVTAR
jgi:phosphatidylethanolamine-binding protein (PEBP) family uncharacterized protein